ncbi:glycosyl transferase [Bacillus endophyticus]|uniref:glycosyltransferase family 4 protein n=1 Tax=Priestia endophytica TaxID=135735 RepID=UPI001D7D6848|nr:glycosyltransferase family 4 protein [Priestia endophytica]MBG9814570.1 glycosyl transferase [Priestia endophytica]
MNNTANKKNVWIFHHYATPPTMNGFTRPFNFGKYFNKFDYETTVFSASYLHFSDINLINDKELYKVDNESGIPFVFIKTTSSANNGLKRVINMVEFYRNLFKVVNLYIKDNKKPDLIIASSPHPLVMAAGIKIAKKLGVPCVCEIRDFWPEVFFMGGKLKERSILGRLLIKGEHWIYKNSDALVFLKEGDTNYLKEKNWTVEQGGDIDLNKCYYINNGVDIETFNQQINSNLLKDQDLLNDKFNVVYTGAIRPVNNVGNILDAAKLLREYKDIQFLIYGEGNQLEDLRERVLNEGLTNVKMKGYVDKKYIPYVLSKSSVNILNYSQTKYNWSRGNSSNKLFEYMASGKPVISTVRMGYCPLERYKCGLSLEKDTPEALAKAVLDIYKMADNDYNQMSINATNGAKDFDYKVLARKFNTIMENLIS